MNYVQICVLLSCFVELWVISQKQTKLRQEIDTVNNLRTIQTRFDMLTSDVRHMLQQTKSENFAAVRNQMEARPNISIKLKEDIEKFEIVPEVSIWSVLSQLPGVLRGRLPATAQSSSGAEGSENFLLSFFETEEGKQFANLIAQNAGTLIGPAGLFIETLRYGYETKWVVTGERHELFHIINRLIDIIQHEMVAIDGYFEII